MKPIVIALAAFLLGCSERPTGELPPTPISHPQDFSPVLKAEWPPHGYTKVVGYRYEFPEIDYCADLLYTENRDGKDFRLNHTKLARLSRVSRELGPVQIERLLTATFAPKGDTGYGACYQPHHIFVFYGPDGVATQAIEVCFGCRNIIVAPEPADGTPSASLRELATLCSDLGLWFQDETLPDYLARL
jgi:hypothetical protein